MNQNFYPFYYNQNLAKDINEKINEKIIYFSSLYILKKISLENEYQNNDTHDENEKKSPFKPIFSIPLEGMNKHIEPVLDHLFVENLIKIDSKTQAYNLSTIGNEYIDNLIEEIENYISQYERYDDIEERVELMKRNNISPFRTRFLWGLYDGEFDNLIEWKNSIYQQPSLKNLFAWQTIITSPEFYIILYQDIYGIKKSIEYIFFYEEHPDFNL